MWRLIGHRPSGPGLGHKMNGDVQSRIPSFIRGEGQVAIMVQYACATYVVLTSRFRKP